MRKFVLVAIVIATVISLIACTSATTPAESITTPKKISLEDAPDILNISLLLPNSFEQIDAADEGMSNEDLELGPECSEVQLYLSEDPFQMIYGFLAIYKSQIDRAVFDRMLEDEDQIEALIRENIMAGAREEGVEITVPDIEITHPNIGDEAMLGEGYMDSWGYQVGFDTVWLRVKTVYVFFYSAYWSSDKVSLIPIAKEIEKRIGRFSQ